MTSNPQGWMGHSGCAVSTVRIIIKGCSHGNSLGIFFSSFPWNISLLRWFDGVSQCQYLLSLNINHVPINNDFKKITNTAVLDRDDNLSWLRLQWYRSCYSNEITYFTCSRISRHWELFFQNRSRKLIPLIATSMFEIYQSVIKILCDEVFMNTNKLKLGQSWVRPLSAKSEAPLKCKLISW